MNPYAPHPVLEMVADWIVDGRAALARLVEQRRWRVLIGVTVAAFVATAVACVAAWALGTLAAFLLAPVAGVFAGAGRNLYTDLFSPLVIDPITAWFRTAGAGLPTDPLLAMVLWLVVGLVLWLLINTRSMQAKVLWPVWGASAAACAAAGAPVEQSWLAAGATGVVWLVLSLVGYARIRRLPPPEDATAARMENLQKLHQAAVTGDAPAAVRARIERDLADVVCAVTPPDEKTQLVHRMAAIDQVARTSVARGVLVTAAAGLGCLLLAGLSGAGVFVVLGALAAVGVVLQVALADIAERPERELDELRR